MPTAIIVAAGKGLRMQRRRPKQFLPLAGRPILSLTLSALSACSRIDRMVVVVPEADFAFCRETVLPAVNSTVEPVLVAGGPRRQDSVFNGLRSLAGGDPNEVVLIHDGVRPFVSPLLVDACIDGAREDGACIPVLPPTDTVKQIDGGGKVVCTLDRSRIRLAQTPQAFRFQVILQAHERARHDGFEATDDASLVERLGRPVRTVTGCRANVKITTPEDLAFAEARIAERLS